MTEPVPVPHGAVAKAAQAAVALERAADGVADELAFLQAAVRARDAEIERLQEVCDDRQLVIDDLTAHSATYRDAAEQRAALLAALDVELNRMRGELERAVAERSAALATAEAAARTLDEERLRARFDASERDSGLRAAHRDAEALRARNAVLEEALAIRAELIEQLQTACDERLTVMERLSTEINQLHRNAEARELQLETVAAGGSSRAQVPDDTDWRGIAEERERSLREVSAEAERRSVLLAEVTAALEGRTQEVEDLRRRLTRVLSSPS